MNLAQSIKQWFLNTGSYYEGVNLYRLTGGDTRNFESYFTANYVPEIEEQRLQQYLSHYLECYQSDLRASTNLPPPKSTREVPNTPLTEQKQEPQLIKDLRVKAKPLHKKYDFLKAELRHQEDEKYCYDTACEIMEDIIPALDNIYDSIRSWEANGELPSPEKHDTGFQEGIAAMRRKGTLEPRISKIKSLLKSKPKATRRQELEKELLEKELELKNINELIAK